MHLDRPFHSQVVISQEYGVSNPMEPFGYKASDESIGYLPFDRSCVSGYWHNGVDYALPCGTPLLAPAAGHILIAGMSPSGFGLRLVVAHGGGILTLYGHLSDIVGNVGTHVLRGDVIAHSGGGNGDHRDGNSTGCHLHWSVLSASFDRYYPPAAYVFGA